jgi:hypothetical protein|tara:strand:- start:132 stop:275 length:144 start_codon:yes stop_codon:yes gene_type:complete
MIKKIIIIFVAITLTSCASLKDKMPKRQACTGEETNKTLAEMLCKKK